MRNRNQILTDSDRQSSMHGTSVETPARLKKPFTAPKLELHDEVSAITGDRHFDWGGTVPIS